LAQVAADALIVEPVGDVADLSDNAETGCGRLSHAPVAFSLRPVISVVTGPETQAMRRLAGFMHRPVGAHEGAGERDRSEVDSADDSAEQMRASGFTVGLPA